MKEHSDSVQSDSPFELLAYYATLASEIKDDGGEAIVATPHYLLFYAADEGFMINIDHIDTIIKEQPLIKVLPFSPVWLKGLSSIRNEIVSVVSFSSLWQDKQSATPGKNYILLRGGMKGFMLEVGDLAGIREVEVEEMKGKKHFIDGRCITDGKSWQRINMDALLMSELTQTEKDF